jgi:hypothetical protein
MWELLLETRHQAEAPLPKEPLSEYDEATLTLPQLEDLVAGRALLSDSYGGESLKLGEDQLEVYLADEHWCGERIV